MRRWLSLLPLAVIVIAVALPLVRHAERQRDEAIAIEILHEVIAAQAELQRSEGGYAAGVAHLTSGCAGAAAALDGAVLTRLQRAGYTLTLRAAAGAASSAGRACPGRQLASDYYAAAAPAAIDRPGRQAFAARADGSIFLFYDGIAPRESDIDSGLATPLSQRDVFKIP